MDLLSKLNPQQHAAVTAGEGPVMVIAGPGSGKTRVLTHRIAYLIAQQGIRPYQMMAVTFTNKAAREMGERVNDLLGDDMTRSMMLGTFHSICARILRREADYLPFTNTFVIFDSDDQIRLTKAIIRELNIDEKRFRPHSVHAAISNAKNELISADDFPIMTYRDEVVKRVYEQYQIRLLASNALDFDDLLLWTANLLENEPAVRDRYGQRFQYILVDEFQDTNLAQYTLIKHLAAVHRNIFAVGDPDQSIYRWRGADYRNIQRFEQDFPESQVILLEKNYRSRQNILDAAMAVIDKAQYRKPKKLFTDRGAGEKIYYYEARDDYNEASHVVDSIAKLVASKQFEPGECAVMYRTNAQSRLLEEAFLQARLPYRLVGAQRFYGRREIKDLIAFLRLAYNPNDQVSLERIINVPTRGIGSKTLDALLLLANRTKASAGTILIDLARGENSAYWQEFSSRAIAPLADFGTNLANWHAAASFNTVAELLDQIIKDIAYRPYIDDDTEEGTERWDNVEELRRLAKEYIGRTMDEFLQDVALISDQDTLAEDKNAPTLLTLHAAKGLEFGAVFIVGLDDGMLPHSRSFDEPEEMEEERRLFYVGLTRAKDKLYLVRAAQRGSRNWAEETYPSRFLDDIPGGLLVGKSRGGKAIRGRSIPDTQWRLPAEPASAPVLEARYRAGNHVSHPVWGDGIVLNSRIQDDDEIVDVAFESVGIKRLAASLAKLTITR